MHGIDLEYAETPGYGTGVDWNEFHTHAEWDQTD